MLTQSLEGRLFELDCPDSVHCGAFEEALPVPCGNKTLSLLDYLLRSEQPERNELVSELHIDKLLELSRICCFLDVQDILRLLTLTISKFIRQHGCDQLDIHNSTQTDLNVLRLHLQRVFQRV